MIFLLREHLAWIQMPLEQKCSYLTQEMQRNDYAFIVVRCIDIVPIGTDNQLDWMCGYQMEVIGDRLVIYTVC